MYLTLRHDRSFGDWSVWASLEPHEDATPVEQQSESFILGTGKTREFAIADAVTHLEGAIARLQVPSMREGESR